MKWLTKKSLVSLVVLALFLIVLLLIVGKRPTRNVLDEIYYSFRDAGALRVGPSPFDMNYVYKPSDVWEPDNIFTFGYEENGILQKNEYIGFYVNLKKEQVLITTWLPTDSVEHLSIIYEYYPRKNRLTIQELFLFTGTFDENGNFTNTDSGELVRQAMERNNITRADVEYYRDYYLYDRIFLDWVEGNGSSSSFSPGKYGNFEIEDNLWKNVDGE